ncbi:hypothetical protein D3C80_1145010 [compost metagenome]
MYPVRHVEGEFGNLEDLPAIIEDGIIRCLDEDAPASLAEPHELAGGEMAGSQPFPEGPVFR